MRIHIKVYEIENQELAFFLYTPSLTSQPEADFEAEPAQFSLVRDDIKYELRLGVEGFWDQPRAYTEVAFSHSLKCDLAVYDESPRPLIDSEHLKLYSSNAVELETRQEKEGIRIDKQIRELLPRIADAISHFREAARLELYDSAVKWDFLVESIKTSQRDRGVKEADLSPEFDDAAYLFAAFRPKSAARLTQDSNIHYIVEDREGRKFDGLIRNSRSGISPVEFATSLGRIQDRLDQGLPIHERVLLAASEFLYADDFRMAVFNAATVFELIVNEKYQAIIRRDDREANRVEREIREYKKSRRKSSHLKAIVKTLLPNILPHDVEWSVLLEKCLEAKHYRDKSVAHPKTADAGRILSRRDAWEMVVSVWRVIAALSPAN